MSSYRNTRSKRNSFLFDDVYAIITGLKLKQKSTKPYERGKERKLLTTVRVLFYT